MSKFDEIVLHEIFACAPCPERAAIFVIGDSYKALPQERKIQLALIENATPGTPVVVESGSYNGSLDAVADMARHRGDLPVVMASVQDKRTDRLLEQGKFAEAAVFAPARDIFATAYDQIHKSPSHRVLVFTGSGLLQGIDAAGRGVKSCIDLPMVTLAADSLVTRGLVYGALTAQLILCGCTNKEIKTERDKVMRALDFTFKNPRVLQLGKRLSKLAL